MMTLQVLGTASANSSAPDLSIGALVAAFLLLAIPVAASHYFRLGLIRESIVAATRMAVQLSFAGIYLTWLFRWDHPVLNLAWLLVMMTVAALTTVQKSQLRWKVILAPVCVSTLVATLAVVLYFNALILRLDQVFMARYLVVIGGMVLGNSLSGNIVSLTHFYQSLRDREERYLYWLGNGATSYESLLPFFREAVIRAVKPTLASMATIGIVALPGMMTGQMLGGSAPMVAIKYQIAIMLAIYATVTLGVVLAILFSSRQAFDSYGILKRGIFAEPR